MFTLDSLYFKIYDIHTSSSKLLGIFVRKSTIFDDGRVSGEFPTNFVEGTSSTGAIYSTITINNTPGSLQLIDHSGSHISVDHSNADALVRYGVVHKINTVLKY